MIRRPPRSTRTDTLFPYTTLFRSRVRNSIGHPPVDLAFRPRNRVSSELHRPRKLALAHPAINRRTAKPDAVLHFGQANKPRHPAGFGRSLVDLFTHDGQIGRAHV